MTDTDRYAGGEPARLAVMVAPPSSTALSTKLALPCPSGTVTVAGTVATAEAFDARFTTTPPAGAAKGSVSVIVSVRPLTTLTDDGLSTSCPAATGSATSLDSRCWPTLTGSGVRKRKRRLPETAGAVSVAPSCVGETNWVVTAAPSTSSVDWALKLRPDKVTATGPWPA